MKYSEVRPEIENGKKITREIWKDGDWIFLSRSEVSLFSFSREKYRTGIYEKPNFYGAMKPICVLDKDKKPLGWLPNKSDLDADDWTVL